MPGLGSSCAIGLAWSSMTCPRPMADGQWGCRTLALKMLCADTTHSPRIQDKPSHHTSPARASQKTGTTTDVLGSRRAHFLEVCHLLLQWPGHGPRQSRTCCRKHVAVALPASGKKCFFVARVAFFFFLLGTLSGDVICLMRHSGTRGSPKKKKRPCDFLGRTDALKTPLGTYRQNFEDTPGAGIMTPQKQREGRHLRPSRQAENNERVTTYALNFEDAPGASITTPQKPREGRHCGHLCPEFRRRSTRQRHDASKTTRGSPPAPRIWKTLHASALHAPASRRAEDNEKVATSSQNFAALRSTRNKKRKNSRRFFFFFFCSARCPAM